jgi:hypothetical protein
VEGAHLLLLLNLTSDGATRSRYRPLGRGATAGIMRPPLEQRRFHLICLHARGNQKFSIGGPGDPLEPDCGWARRR